jgi:hypothetical protein
MKQGLKLIGAVPFGFDNGNGQLTPNPAEMKTAQKIVSLRQQGRSYLHISDHLNAQRIASKNGGKWHPKTVLGVLRHICSLPGDHWVIKKYFPKGVEINVSKAKRR